MNQRKVILTEEGLHHKLLWKNIHGWLYKERDEEDSD